ncbi:MAG: bifunctional DNA primase/polymerase, partial [Paracoccaceae bacterium]
MNARAHPMLDLALAYAAKGYRVFPCGQDKRPLTPHGFKDASAAPDTIRAWWRQHPHAMVGLPTGDGLAVVDLDVDKGTGEAIGESTADALGWGDVLAAGLTVRTPSGGRHVYFAGNVPTKARTFGPGVDTRGAGGYVIAAGSITG